MKNVARGSVLLTILAFVIGANYFPQRAEAALAIANNSQNLTTEYVKETINSESLTDDKLVRKTAIVKKTNARGFRATAYCLKGRTANGGGVRRGIVAADPRILPLGSKIYVDAGAYSGTYTVTDTGGAIKGNILDIWVPSCSEAVKFGRRSISVSRL